jgi:hypothetical protein
MNTVSYLAVTSCFQQLERWLVAEFQPIPVTHPPSQRQGGPIAEPCNLKPLARRSRGLFEDRLIATIPENLSPVVNLMRRSVQFENGDGAQPSAGPRRRRPSSARVRPLPA